MGIRNLTKDLQSFSQSAILDGSTNTSTLRTDEVRICRIVIDGPSLVYHVYYGLLHQMSIAELSTGLVPTYEDVVEGVKSFVGEVQGREIDM
jgi:hypothetical protein